MDVSQDETRGTVPQSTTRSRNSSILDPNLQKFKVVTKSNQKWKKSEMKKTRHYYIGQTASSLKPYECNA